jgi:glycosyltransferase involved in cell wall biosynthesis
VVLGEDAEPMKVLILNQYALPKGAAGITRHGDIGAELVSRGHDVTVVASDFDYFARRPGNRPKESRHDGVRFIWLRTGAYVENDSRRIRSMLRFAQAAVWAGVRMMPRPDIIIGSSPHLLTPVSAASAARLMRRPWILEVRDFWPSSLVDLGAIKRGGRVHRVLEALERRLYLDADAVVTVPPHGRRRLEEVRAAAVTLLHIPNATHWREEAATQLPASVSEILDEFGDRFLIVYTGALGAAQDLPTVLSGLAHLRRHRPDVFDRLAVLLVGDGVERERTAKSAIAMQLDNVRIHAAIDKAAVSRLLDAADVCLLHLAAADVFKYGLSPNKLFDYLAAGKPVLISSEHETVADEAGAGVRYRPGDPSALADAVAQVVEMSPDERAFMGKRGRELVRTRYTTSAITDQYEALLQGVIAQR